MVDSEAAWDLPMVASAVDQVAIKAAWALPSEVSVEELKEVLGAKVVSVGHQQVVTVDHNQQVVKVEARVPLHSTRFSATPSDYIEKNEQKTPCLVNDKSFLNNF